MSTPFWNNEIEPFCIIPARFDIFDLEIGKTRTDHDIAKQAEDLIPESEDKGAFKSRVRGPCVFKRETALDLPSKVRWR